MKTVLVVVGIVVAAVAVWWLFLRKRAQASADIATRLASFDRGTGSTLIRPTAGAAGALVPWLEPTSSPVSVWVGQASVPTPTGGLFSPLQRQLALVV